MPGRPHRIPMLLIALAVLPSGAGASFVCTQGELATRVDDNRDRILRAFRDMESAVDSAHLYLKSMHGKTKHMIDNMDEFFASRAHFHNVSTFAPCNAHVDGQDNLGSCTRECRIVTEESECLAKGCKWKQGPGPPCQSMGGCLGRQDSVVDEGNVTHLCGLQCFGYLTPEECATDAQRPAAWAADGIHEPQCKWARMTATEGGCISFCPYVRDYCLTESFPPMPGAQWDNTDPNRVSDTMVMPGLLAQPEKLRKTIHFSNLVDDIFPVLYDSVKEFVTAVYYIAEPEEGTWLSMHPPVPTKGFENTYGGLCNLVPNIPFWSWWDFPTFIPNHPTYNPGPVAEVPPQVNRSGYYSVPYMDHIVLGQLLLTYCKPPYDSDGVWRGGLCLDINLEYLANALAVNRATAGSHSLIVSNDYLRDGVASGSVNSGVRLVTARPDAVGLIYGLGKTLWDTVGKDPGDPGVSIEDVGGDFRRLPAMLQDASTPQPQVFRAEDGKDYYVRWEPFTPPLTEFLLLSLVPIVEIDAAAVWHVEARGPACTMPDSCVWLLAEPADTVQAPEPIDLVLRNDGELPAAFQLGSAETAQYLEFSQAVLAIPAGSSRTVSVRWLPQAWNASAPAVMHLKLEVTPTGEYELCFLPRALDLRVVWTGKPCSSGSQMDAELGCVPCPQETFNPSTAGTCTACPAGRHAPELASTACALCPVGTYSPGNQVGCLACSVGYEALEEGTSQCSPCGRGSYKGANMSSCAPCLPGSTAEDKGLNECVPCPAGSAASQSGQETCDRCPPTSFADGEGNTACTPCGGLLVAEFPGATSQAECQCPENLYRDAADRDRCLECKEGMVCAWGSNAARGAPRHPALLPSFWSSAQEPLSVFRCESEQRCKGGNPLEANSCGEHLEGISCGRCEDGFVWAGDGCDKCRDAETTKFIFPILPMLLVPTIVAVLYKISGDDYALWGAAKSGIASVVFVALNHYQIISMMRGLNIEFTRDVRSFYDTFAISSDMSSLFRPGCAGFDIQASMGVKVAFPAIYLLLGWATWATSNLLGRIPALSWAAMEKNRAFNAVASMMMTFFAGCVNLALVLFVCKPNPNGKSTLNIDRSVICFEETWDGMLGLGLTAILLWCIGVGAVFTWATFSSLSRMQEPSVRMRWKFLFNKFRNDVYWWSLVFIAKGILLNVGLVAMPSGAGQLYWIIATLTVYVGLAAFFRPWRHMPVNVVDIASHQGLILSAACLLWYAKEAVGEAERASLDRDLDRLTIAMGSLLVPLAMAMVALMFYQERAPGQLAKKQKAIEQIRVVISSLAAASDEDFASFAQGLSEWDLWSLRCAAEATSFEFLGEKSRPGYITQGVSRELSDERKSQSFSV